MILLLNFEELSVNEFIFDNFGPETPEHKHEEPKDIIYPSFVNDDDLIAQEQDCIEQYEFPNNDATAQYCEAAMEELCRKRAEIEEESKQIISAANKQADVIIKKAQMEAEELKKKAHAEGLEKGYTEGYNVAYEKNKAKLEKETVSFLLEMKDIINEYREINDRLVAQNIDELKDVAVSIAEKIVQVSLKTSGEIIKKMIISATEKMRYKEWARIYISRLDSSLLIEGNTDLMRSLAHVSENIKIITMEDATPGTCIIELPDQVIDASAPTQIENIRNTLKGVNVSGR